MTSVVSTMKILALGGSGQQGGSAVRALLRFDEVTAVTVADIDIAAAQSFCEELAADHIRALELDVTDEAVLKRTMAEHDVVLNCVGPFYRFAEAVVSSAIGAGVNYVDICDDTAPTIYRVTLTPAMSPIRAAAWVWMRFCWALNHWVWRITIRSL